MGDASRRAKPCRGALEPGLGADAVNARLRRAKVLLRAAAGVMLIGGICVDAGMAWGWEG